MFSLIRYFTLGVVTGGLWLAGLVLFVLTAWRPAYDGIWLASSMCLIGGLLGTIRIWHVTVTEADRLEHERLATIERSNA